LWVVDYDVPREPKAKRMAFYRALWRILKEHKIIAKARSTMSVWILDNEEIAAEIHDLASKFGKSHLYEARPVA